MSLIESFTENLKDQMNEFDYLGSYNNLSINNEYCKEELLRLINVFAYYYLINSINEREYNLLVSLKMMLIDKEATLTKIDLLFMYAHLDYLYSKIDKKKSMDNLTMYT